MSRSSIDIEIRNIRQAIESNHWNRVLRHAHVGRVNTALQFKFGEAKTSLIVTTPNNVFHAEFRIKGPRVECIGEFRWGPTPRKVRATGNSFHEAWVSLHNK